MEFDEITLSQKLIAAVCSAAVVVVLSFMFLGGGNPGDYKKPLYIPGDLVNLKLDGKQILIMSSNCSTESCSYKGKHNKWSYNHIVEEFEISRKVAQ